ncbi:MAG: SIMPL domain-containing protein [Prochlorococcaceae cyanobacterium]
MLASLLIPVPLLALALGGAALGQTQLQLSCSGTVLESSGRAEIQRAIDALEVSLRLESQGATAEEALAELQLRLAAVRTALQELNVEELQVSSPSTWPRPAQRGRGQVVGANLSVQGRLQPQRLQQLVRQVGSLPGVRLAPVGTRADALQNRETRRRLLQLAYQDALELAQDMAAAIGLRQLQPLNVVVEGGPRPMPMRAMAAAEATVPPFDPDELARPTDRLQLQVVFCAR